MDIYLLLSWAVVALLTVALGLWLIGRHFDRRNQLVCDRYYQAGRLLMAIALGFLLGLIIAKPDEFNFFTWRP